VPLIAEGGVAGTRQSKAGQAGLPQDEVTRSLHVPLPPKPQTPQLPDQSCSLRAAQGTE
jgi:hypothetical protein